MWSFFRVQLQAASSASISTTTIIIRYGAHSIHCCYQLPRHDTIFFIYWNFEWNTISLCQWRTTGDKRDAMRLTGCTIALSQPPQLAPRDAPFHVLGHHNCFHFPLKLIGNRIRNSIWFGVQMRQTGWRRRFRQDSRRQQFSLRFHLTYIHGFSFWRNTSS